MKLEALIRVTDRNKGGLQDPIILREGNHFEKLDIRKKIISHLSNYAGSAKVIHFVHSLETDGVIIGIVKVVNNLSLGSDDNTTAWIFIPAKIKITAEDIFCLVETIKEELSNELSINYDRLTNLFAKEYDEINCRNSVRWQGEPANNGKLAVRYYGQGTNYSLQDLLGDALYQKEYRQYDYVFFIDTESGIKVDNSTVTKIEKPLQKLVTINIPSKEDFTPYYNDKVLKGGIETYENEPIVIEWRREGYKTIRKSGTKDADFTIQPNEIKYEIRYDAFQVWSDDNNYDIRINGKIIEKEQPVYVSEAEIRRVTLKVTAAGYEDYEKVLDFSAKKEYTISLNAKKYSYTLYFGDADKIITKEITSKEADKIQIKGYKKDKDGTYITFKYAPKHWLWGILIAFAFLLGVAGGAVYVRFTKVNHLNSQIETLKRQNDNYREREKLRNKTSAEPAQKQEVNEEKKTEYKPAEQLKQPQKKVEEPRKTPPAANPDKKTEKKSDKSTPNSDNL